MTRFVDVIRGDATIRSAEELNHRQFFESALYNEIWRPQRLHYRLEAIVRSRDGRPLGSLVLYREQGDRIFDRADEQTLQTLLPYVAHGLLRGREARVDYARDEHRSAWVNLDAAGRIVHLSRDAFKVLLLAHGDVSPAAAAQTPASQSFATLVLLHRQLSRSGMAPASPCALSLSNAWGQFDFRAERLEPVGGAEAPLIGVTIRHRVPRAVRDLETLEAFALSITQKKVCTRLLQGLSQPQIAVQLGVSPHTVVDHIRKIYLKLDVHSVDELRARIGERSGHDAARA
jgi:DNA-binding CsgD family transcriptional regulator